MRTRILVWVTLVIVIVAALLLPVMTTRAADAAWTGFYYQNQNLQGQPNFTRQDPVISFDWGDGPPVSEPGWWGDNFSVRWERTDTFQNGLYVFAAASDDGVRMYVDGQLIIDEWFGRQGSWVVKELQMTGGDHRIVVEYYEETGRAAIQAGYYLKTPGGGTGTGTGTGTGSGGTGSGGGSVAPTPRPTSTPLPTPTPFSGVVAGVEAAAPPPVESQRMVEETSGKAFAWTGFPGPVARSSGHAGLHSYVKNRRDKATFSVRWYYQFDVAGYYDVYVYIPSSANATESAMYYVFHANELSSAIEVDQSANPDRWVKLGSYYFLANVPQYVSLNNVTGEPSASREVLLDAVMFVFSP